MVLKLLQERGALSDEYLSFEDLQQLGVRSFVELLPMLDKIEQADLIQRRPNSPATIYDPIELPAVEDLEE
jgi:hypothetical protein